MTANQLKYWELRWKQYYEYYYLEEQKRSNRAREYETQRHNQVLEKISKQELVLRRIELDQAQEKINQEWAKIEVTDRANYVHAVIESNKLELQSEELKIKKAKNDQEIQESKARVKQINTEIAKLEAEIEKILSSKQIAEADAAIGIVNAVREQDRKDTQLILDSYKHGWGEKFAYELEKGLRENHTDVDEFLKQYGLTPPPKPRSNVSKWDEKYNNNNNNEETDLSGKQLNQYKNIGGLSSNTIKQYNEAVSNLRKKNVEQFGPDISKYKRQSNANVSTPSGITVSTPSNASQNKVATPSGTTIIYSPGTGNKIGPGYI